MRIIGGEWRGRRLYAPASAAIRPTSDRARETLFNILAHGLVAFDGLAVADVYAGTGALGFEALSRGAPRAIFADQNPAALTLIRRNAAALSAEEKIRVIKCDARRLPPLETPADLVFLDPPYRMNLIPLTLQSLKSQGWLKAGSVVVMEMAHDEDVALPAWAELLKERDVGEGKFIIAAVK